MDGRSFNFIDDGQFTVPWHFHPEIEITLIEKGEGYRLIGHYEKPFESGDLVLLGPNLPHVWRLDSKWQKKEIGLKHDSKVIQFEMNSWGLTLFNSPEFSKIKQLLERAKRGIRFKDSTKELVREKILSFADLTSIQQFTSIVSILEIMASSEEEDYEYLTPVGYLENLDLSVVKSGRLAHVITYILNNYTRDISLQEVAAIANMNPSSFSRYFTNVVGKNFTTFLTERRINAACQLLICSELNISEIALDCGYPTLSNFNKHFKKLRGVSASKYKKNNITVC